MLKDRVQNKKNQPVLGRRKFAQGLAMGSGLVALNALLPTKAMGFSHEDLLGDDSGSGHDHDWAAIVKTFRDGLTTIAKAAGPAGKAYADILDALNLKEKASLVRKQAKNIEDKGDSLGASDIEESTKVAGDALEEVKALDVKAATLTADQKKKIEAGMAKYVPALGTAIKGAVKLVEAGSSVSGAGTPGPMDGIEAVDAATAIPEVAPAAVEFVQQSYAVGETLYKIAQVADIATPELPTDEMKGFG